MKIVILSHVCIDQNISENAEYRSFGSPGMYMHLLLNNFPDAECTIISNYGKDFEEFSSKVNLYPKEPKFEKTMLNTNDSTGKVRKQSSSLRENNVKVEIDDEMIKLISQADILVAAPLLPEYDADYLKKFISYTKKDVIKVLLPQGYFRQFDENDQQFFREFNEAEDILLLFDLVILSDADYPNIEEQIKMWLSEIATTIIMTRGENGARYYSENEVKDVPTERVTNIVDSVGSGDIFSASFAYQYFKTKDLTQSINFANKIAGICLGYSAVDIIAGKVKF